MNEMNFNNVSVLDTLSAEEMKNIEHNLPAVVVENSQLKACNRRMQRQIKHLQSQYQWYQNSIGGGDSNNEYNINHNNNGNNNDRHDYSNHQNFSMVPAHIFETYLLNSNSKHNTNEWSDNKFISNESRMLTRLEKDIVRKQDQLNEQTEQLSKEWEKYYQQKQELEKEKRELRSLSRELVRKNRILEMKESKMNWLQQSKTLEESQSLLHLSSRYYNSNIKDQQQQQQQDETNNKKYVNRFQNLEVQLIRDSMQNHTVKPTDNNDQITKTESNVGENQIKADVHPFAKLKIFDSQKKLEELEDRIVTLLENQSKNGYDNFNHKSRRELEREIDKGLKNKIDEPRTNGKKWISKSARQSRRNSAQRKKKQLNNNKPGENLTNDDTLNKQKSRRSQPFDSSPLHQNKDKIDNKTGLSQIESDQKHANDTDSEEDRTNNNTPQINKISSANQTPSRKDQTPISYQSEEDRTPLSTIETNTKNKLDKETSSIIEEEEVDEFNENYISEETDSDFEYNGTERKSKMGDFEQGIDTENDDDFPVSNSTEQKIPQKDESGDELDEEMTELEHLSIELSRMKTKHYGYRQLLEHLKNDRIHLWEQIEELSETNSQLAHNIQEMTQQTRDANLLKQELLNKEKELDEHQLVIENYTKEIKDMSTQVEEKSQQCEILEKQMNRMHNDIHSYIEDIKLYFAYILSALMDLYNNSYEILNASHFNNTKSDLINQNGHSKNKKKSTMEWMMKYIEQSETLPMFDCIHEHKKEESKNANVVKNNQTISYVSKYDTHHNRKEYVLPAVIYQLQHLLQEMLKEIMLVKNKNDTQENRATEYKKEHSISNGKEEISSIRSTKSNLTHIQEMEKLNKERENLYQMYMKYKRTSQVLEEKCHRYKQELKKLRPLGEEVSLLKSRIDALQQVLTDERAQFQRNQEKMEESNDKHLKMIDQLIKQQQRERNRSEWLSRLGSMFGGELANVHDMLFSTGMQDDLEESMEQDEPENQRVKELLAEVHSNEKEHAKQNPTKLDTKKTSTGDFVKVQQDQIPLNEEEESTYRSAENNQETEKNETPKENKKRNSQRNRADTTIGPDDEYEDGQLHPTDNSLTEEPKNTIHTSSSSAEVSPPPPLAINRKDSKNMELLLSSIESFRKSPDMEMVAQPLLPLESAEFPAPRQFTMPKKGHDSIQLSELSDFDDQTGTRLSHPMLNLKDFSATSSNFSNKSTQKRRLSTELASTTNKLQLNIDVSAGFISLEEEVDTIDDKLETGRLSFSNAESGYISPTKKRAPRNQLAIDALKGSTSPAYASVAAGHTMIPLMQIPDGALHNDEEEEEDNEETNNIRSLKYKSQLENQSNQTKENTTLNVEQNNENNTENKENDTKVSEISGLTVSITDPEEKEDTWQRFASNSSPNATMHPNNDADFFHVKNIPSITSEMSDASSGSENYVDLSETMRISRQELKEKLQAAKDNADGSATSASKNQNSETNEQSGNFGKNKKVNPRTNKEDNGHEDIRGSRPSMKQNNESMDIDNDKNNSNNIPSFAPHQKQPHRFNRERTDTVTSNQSTVNDIPGLDGFQKTQMKALLEQNSDAINIRNENINKTDRLQKLTLKENTNNVNLTTPSLKDVRHTRDGTQVVRVKHLKNESTESNLEESKTLKFPTHSPESSLLPKLTDDDHYKTSSVQYAVKIDGVDDPDHLRNDSVISDLGTHYVQYSVDVNDNMAKPEKNDSMSVSFPLSSIGQYEQKHFGRPQLDSNQKLDKQTNVHDRTESQQSTIELDDALLQK